MLKLNENGRAGALPPPACCELENSHSNKQREKSLLHQLLVMIFEHIFLSSGHLCPSVNLSFLFPFFFSSLSPRLRIIHFEMKTHQATPLPQFKFNTGNRNSPVYLFIFLMSFLFLNAFLCLNSKDKKMQVDTEMSNKCTTSPSLTILGWNKR